MCIVCALRYSKIRALTKLHSAGVAVLWAEDKAGARVEERALLARGEEAGGKEGAEADV